MRLANRLMAVRQQQRNSIRNIFTLPAAHIRTHAWASLHVYVDMLRMRLPARNAVIAYHVIAFNSDIVV